LEQLIVQTTTGNTSQIHVVRLLSSDPGRVRTLSRVIRSSARSIPSKRQSVIESAPFRMNKIGGLCGRPRAAPERQSL